MLPRSRHQTPLVSSAPCRLKDLKDDSDALAASCIMCLQSDFDKDGFSDRTVIICDQCEREYHVGCLRKVGACMVDVLVGVLQCGRQHLCYLAKLHLDTCGLDEGADGDIHILGSTQLTMFPISTLIIVRSPSAATCRVCQRGSGTAAPSAQQCEMLWSSRWVRNYLAGPSV